MRHCRSFFACAALGLVAVTLAPGTARAANVLFVSDGTSDTGIATALMADGHTVTIVTNDLGRDGINRTLVGPLDGYDVVFWSGDGCSGGFHDPSTYTALTAYVMGGGRVFYTGYDSTFSGTEFQTFMGFTDSFDQVGVTPTPISSVPSSLSQGIRDITGVTPSDGYTDKDCMSGAGPDVQIVSESSSFSGCAQWAVRTLGDGEIAWVSNGTCGSDHASWTNTSSTFNAAVRNFAYAADSSSGVCTGTPDGAACTSGTGVAGTCHAGRCCTGCWDGAACRSGRTTATCGVNGGACVRCVALSFCESDMCTDGVCGGSPCDDGESCTTDSCDEAADRCNHVVTSGCIVGGECVGEGEHHVAYPCLVCDSARDATDWSPVAAGSSCGADRCASGRLFQGGACDAVGECVAPRVTICETETCDGTMCATPCTPTSCGTGERCNARGVCVGLSILGDSCAASDECAAGNCVDGVCCADTCDGVCESCNLPGNEGMCTAIADGTDPYAECSGGRTCDGAGACQVPGVRDAGTDAGPRTDSGPAGDAGVGFDGGIVEAPRGGCSAVPGSRTGAGSVVFVLGLGIAFVRGRRRVGSRAAGGPSPITRV